MTRLCVATVAGSDPSGGAGLQTDLRVFTLLGAYGQAVVTALTVQNSLGVKDWQPVSGPLVYDQLQALFEDFPPQALKTGMLATAEVMEAVAEALSRYRPLLVVDPVLVAQSGVPLLEEKALSVLKDKIIPLATVVTPNLPEAQVLTGKEEPQEILSELKALGAKAVVLKGGHAEGPQVRDVLFDGERNLSFEVPRVEGPLGHGTGCTFSAALTVFLAQGHPLPEAVFKAQRFVYLGLLAAQKGPLGRGVSPLDHLIHLDRLKAGREVLEALKAAVQRFCAAPVRALIPEVQTNLAYALPFAQDFQEVAAIPGRIVAFGQGARAVGCPEFGASRHVANVVLTAMRYDPLQRAAINIRFQERYLQRARDLGLVVGEFSRAEEPPFVKAQEGSTLVWGVDQVCKRLGKVPDLIADRGDLGKEPMIRILGKDPQEVVEKALKFLC